MRSLLLPEEVLETCGGISQMSLLWNLMLKTFLEKKALTYIHIYMVHFKVGYFYNCIFY